MNGSTYPAASPTRNTPSAATARAVRVSGGVPVQSAAGQRRRHGKAGGVQNRRRRRSRSAVRFEERQIVGPGEVQFAPLRDRRPHVPARRDGHVNRAGGEERRIEGRPAASSHPAPTRLPGRTTDDAMEPRPSGSVSLRSCVARDAP